MPVNHRQVFRLTGDRLHDSFRAMSREIYSLRMHSSRGEKHISGAERLLDFSELEASTLAMLSRALHHPRGAAEKISLTIQSLDHAQVLKRPLLKLSTIESSGWIQGRECAQGLLENLGLESTLISNAISLLAAGPAPCGGVMRGAMLIDAVTGQRLEPDQSRGVRVSRMDIDPDSRSKIELLLRKQSIGKPQVIEAWVLASKVALYPQVVAELCWSDDPEYLTGYVASAKMGYQRITQLKEIGSEIGGRIFFIKPAIKLTELIEKFQFEPVLFDLPLSE